MEADANVWKRFRLKLEEVENGWSEECRCGGEFVLDSGEAEEDGVVVIVDCDTCSLAVEVRFETAGT